MRRRRPKAKRKRDQLFVGLEFWELETEAFEHLSADATRVYMFMRKRYNGSNNGQVIFSWRDAMHVLRSGFDRAGKALRELRAKGFVKLRTPGEPGPRAHPNIRPAGEWQLTVFECGGQPASKDFARWRADPEKQLPTPETGAPRSRNRSAYPGMETLMSPKTPQSAPETGAPRPPERTQNRSTCRSTTHGGPGNEHQRESVCESAPPRAGNHLCEWRAPSLIEVPSGPKGNRASRAAWLREHLNAGTITAEAVAAELRIGPDDVAGIAAGRTELGSSIWAKIGALVERAAN